MNVKNRNPKGAALPLALFALVMLSGLLLAFLTMSGMEPEIAANLNDVVRARYLAEGGIEWAFDQLVTASAQPNGWNTLLTTNNGQMANNMVLPGLAANFGTFSVTVRNDTLATDTQITGVAPDGGGAGTDTNNVVILSSTGTFKGTTRQIQQVLTHITIPVPGGVNLPGVGTNTKFSGNSFTITGNDTNVDGTPGTCAAGWGIGVANAATELLVESSLNPQQKNNVTGKKQNPLLAGQGDNTIAPDASMTPAMIAKFVNDIKGSADITLNASASDKLVYQNLGNTCSTNLNDSNCWGTFAKPKIVYIKGTLDPAQAFYALTVSGTSTGAGILILEDGDASISGNFNWDGLIVITGQYVGLKYGGGGNQTVYGGVVVNETAAINSEVEVDATGNAKVYYSCQAINNAKNSRKLYRVTSWREL